MHLYGLTVAKGGAIVAACFGSFSEPKAQEVVVAHPTSLALLRHDVSSGRMSEITRVPVFGAIRAIKPFRLTGAETDYIVVGSDSGKISILNFDTDRNTFIQVQQETFGKTGCRRIVPGELLAVDPNGRAVMIGALEKQKFVYILTRDSSANLIISSPLEAHKSNTIVYDMCGVDVGFENPLFACLEVDYENANEKGIAPTMLTYYELDLGVNHVTRKLTQRVNDGANALVSVPGDADGPGGVLILCENCVAYHVPDGGELKMAPLPRRIGTGDNEKIMLVSHASHRQKGFFFFLLQSELGDLYKLSLSYNDQGVSDIHIKYFDTVPVAASLCLLQTGFLFVAAEFSSHYLFPFKSLGDDDNSIESTTDSVGTVQYFTPRKLTNLATVDEIESMSPILHMSMADLAQENSSQIYALCGRGPHSSLRVLRHGLSVNEMAVSDVPGNPNSVWAVRSTASDEFHSYIVVSYTNATLILSIGETVEEVSDSGFLNNTQTLHVGLLGESTLVQVHPEGVRLVLHDKRISQWQPPGKKQITHCAMNHSQVAISMTGGELAYFEADNSGSLNEIERKEMRTDICSLSLSPVPEGRQRAKYLAVGCFDNTVLLHSVNDPTEPLRQLTIQAVGAQPHSLHIAMLNASAGLRDREATQTFLFVGLANGVLIRSQIDHTNNSLLDARKRFLGNRPIRVFEVSIEGQIAVLALSSRSWLCYTHQSRLISTPLSYDILEYACAFQSEQCPEGVVAISGTTLRIVSIDKLGETFNQTVTPLNYTPRQMVMHPGNGLAIIIESDSRMFSPEGLKNLPKEVIQCMGQKRENRDEDEDEDEEEFENDFRGIPRAPVGQWASCIRVMDPVSSQTFSQLFLEENEAAFSVTTVEFSERGSDVFLAVGCAKDLTLKPRKMSSASIHLYRFSEKNSLELVYKTPVETLAMSLLAFQGRLLAGIGSTLRIYDMGKKKLLRKSENKNFPTSIIGLRAQGDRIYVNDMCESIFFVRYQRAEKQLELFADTTNPRYLTDTEILDYNTVAGADKFGNIFISRVPDDCSHDEDALSFSAADAIINGAPNKLSTIVNYHVGDVVSTLCKASLVPGSQPGLFYGTISGAIGVLLPFTSKEDIDFYSHLEMHLRQLAPPLCGRDHLVFRSAYWPVKSCIDGDLCETFPTLPFDTQENIANEMSFTVPEITKKLDEIRNRFL